MRATLPADSSLSSFEDFVGVRVVAPRMIGPERIAQVFPSDNLAIRFRQLDQVLKKGWAGSLIRIPCLRSSCRTRPASNTPNRKPRHFSAGHFILDPNGFYTRIAISTNEVSRSGMCVFPKCSLMEG